MTGTKERGGLHKFRCLPLGVGGRKRGRGGDRGIKGSYTDLPTYVSVHQEDDIRGKGETFYAHVQKWKKCGAIMATLEAGGRRY